ncbi:MAG: hypothetical protein GX628_09660 [Clostridiales bacterium]|nr:hypothetical protein [Clostridiales bacterium]
MRGLCRRLGSGNNTGSPFGAGRIHRGRHLTAGHTAGFGNTGTLRSSVG